MITRGKKEEIVNSVKGNLEKANAVFLTNLIGIPSNNANSLRKNIRDAGGHIIISRNTLLKKAVAGTEYEGLLEGIKGPSALAFSFEEASAVAKVLYDTSKDQEVVALKKGMMEGKVLSGKDVEALAKLPSKDQMLSTLLATFMAPISSFARVIDEVRKQKEAGAES